MVLGKPVGRWGADMGHPDYSAHALADWNYFAADDCGRMTNKRSGITSDPNGEDNPN